MEFDRRVQVRVHRPGKKRGFGSGYLVAPRLVLTAGHVLGDASGPRPGTVTVCRPDAGDQEFPATVRWYRKDDAVDGALVEVDDGHGWEPPESLADLRTRPPQRWGQIIGTRPHTVTIAGFPRMQRSPGDGRRLDEQLTGTIRPGTGSLARRYEVFSTDPTIPVELPPDSKGTGWSGMSGAALLCGDLLCGVVRRDRQATGGTRLTATPLNALLVDDAFHALVTAHCQWEPILEPAEPAGLLTPAARERDLRSPAMLLRADVEAVTFHGRDHELDQLLHWCLHDPDTFSVRVLTGPGGQGKTRLARHLTDTLRQQGWITGYLRANLPDTTAADLSGLDTAYPLLVAVDYAETRPHLVRHLTEHLHTTRHPTRLLLLARSDGPWRTDTLGATAPAREVLAAALVMDLIPLFPRSAPPGARTNAFSRATADLARLLPHLSGLLEADWAAVAAMVPAPHDLADPRYESVLTLQMTALTALLQHGPEPVETTLDEPAEATLLRHEQRYWEDTAKTPAFQLGDLRTTTLQRAVAVAAVCGAADRAEAEATVRKVPGLPPARALDAAEWLRSLYPAGPDRYWGSLQPDRVAEYHAARLLTGPGTPLPTLMSGASADQQAQVITVLARAAIGHYNARRTAESESILQALNTALDATTLHTEALQNATATLPSPAHVLNAFALRLANELTHAHRQLAQENPAAFEPYLARSLRHLGVQLSRVGREEEAVAAEQQAVKILRPLAQRDPALEPYLAESLNDLGVDLSAVGQKDQAWIATGQAVEIYRRLAAINPAIFEPDLANSLSNEGFDAWAAGQQEWAVAIEQESVEIYRRLARANPAAFEPDLAHTLSRLGILLSLVGRRGEALAAEQQAVEIRRRLAAENPAAFEPGLAISLNNLGLRLSEMGRRGEALAAAQQAVEIRRRLAADNPAAFEPGLARSLWASASVRVELQHDFPGALRAVEEAVGRFRRLVAARPAVFVRDLREVLGTQADVLDGLGRTGEADKIRRRLATEDLDD
jgi:tetratricopeptide (TPR) repeat protein